MIASGDVWAIPVPKLGYTPAVVARAPKPDAECDFALIYVPDTHSTSLPTPGSIRPLAEWSRAWIGLVGCTAMRKGRWTRVGVLPGFDPSLWPVPPSRSSNVGDKTHDAETLNRIGGERWSIETSPDEATMFVLANDASTRDEAPQFPMISVARPSSLEKGLSKFFRGAVPCFHDYEVTVDAITPERLTLWTSYANAVRARTPDPRGPGLSAGRTVDRHLTGGDWLAFPLAGGGFGAGLIVEKPPEHLRVFADTVVMSVNRRWNHWPTLADVASLTVNDGAMVSQTSMICVRDGRWRRLGSHPGFAAVDWPWPRPWHVHHKVKTPGRICVRVGQNDFRHIFVDPKVLALDPDSGKCCDGSSSYGSFECKTLPYANGMTLAGTSLGQVVGVLGDRVTPQRAAAWQAINAAINRALARPMHEDEPDPDREP